MTEPIKGRVRKSEAGEGLIRAQILTKKGNKVWRMVRPDNPNIIPEEGVAVARRARALQNTAPAKPVVVEPEAPKAPVTKYAAMSFINCCGARLLDFKVEAPGIELTMEEKRAAYERTQMYTHLKSHEKHVKALGEYIPKSWEDEKAPARSLFHTLGDYYYGGYYQRVGYTWERLKPTVDRELKTYERYVKDYSFESYLERGDISGGHVNWLDKVGKQNGIVICQVEFEGATKTPAGVYVRGDYFWSDRDAFDKKVVKTPEKAVEKLPEGFKAGASGYTYMTVGPSYSNADIVPIYLGTAVAGSTIWGFIKSQKVKPGQVVMFIRTDRQMNADIAKNMADCGFHCCLVTGNQNHPNSSVLYLYERRITQEDIDTINAKPKKKEKATNELG